MARFASAARPTNRSSELGLCWLAGLLEAEGSFLKPVPSSPRLPIVRCTMTDRDVMDRVAERFGTKTVAIDKGRYRTEYAAALRGLQAVELMRDLRPLMGERRKHAIDAAVRGYRSPVRKLDFSAAEEIREGYVNGQSVSSLSRGFQISRPTVREVLQGTIYATPPQARWRFLPEFLRKPISTPPHLSVRELCWLAGWLEGEGSFCAPPPSDPRRPRIVGQSRDRDVVEEVARLLEVSALSGYDKRARERGWSPTWRVLRQGPKAVALMQALQPLMGRRRSLQIQRAIAATPRSALLTPREPVPGRT
jgi:hypothetical protein